ncbi:MAG: hypothetical protein IPM47_13440 [Sphingobacteriales bacterium]|nr:MAG: hypothetical protein IPM47_13440 [Sphingobacteriales bacterium]
MDVTHLHLLLNHFPIIGTLIGCVVLIFGLLKKSREVQLVACYLLIVMAFVSYPVMETGEGAEDTVEKIAGVSETIMHNHEEAAESAFTVMIITGILSLLSVILHFLKKSYFIWSAIITSIVAAVAFGFMANAGYIGGQIRHTEIHSPHLLNNSTTNSTLQNDTDDD